MKFESMYKSFDNEKTEILQIGFWVDLTPFVLEMIYSIYDRKKCPRTFFSCTGIHPVYRVAQLEWNDSIWETGGSRRKVKFSRIGVNRHLSSFPEKCSGTPDLEINHCFIITPSGTPTFHVFLRSWKGIFYLTWYLARLTSYHMIGSFLGWL